MDRLFKSYYVVWKQAEGEDIFQGDVWFKSYYVVWKQSFAQIFTQVVSGLNRTM